MTDWLPRKGDRVMFSEERASDPYTRRHRHRGGTVKAVRWYDYEPLDEDDIPCRGWNIHVLWDGRKTAQIEDISGLRPEARYVEFSAAWGWKIPKGIIAAALLLAGCTGPVDTSAVSAAPPPTMKGRTVTYPQPMVWTPEMIQAYTPPPRPAEPPILLCSIAGNTIMCI